jgi:EAL domain-containing protein (putative c-di-GMP-specific phosphodiesterase class I)/PAS domain-containing protein
MRQPIKVLVIEDHRSDRFIAQQLLREYDLEFSWQRVASEPELRAVAKAFNPSLVFCADELATNSRHAALDMLRLLALRTVEIHVAEVGDMDGSRAPRPSRLSAARLVGSDAIQASAPSAEGRKLLPRLLEASEDLVATSDAAGWIVYANTKTSRLLGELHRQSIGSVLGLAYDFASPQPGPPRLAFFDASTGLPKPVHLSDLISFMMARARADRTAIPIVALDLQALSFMNELCGGTSAARCGVIARVGADDIVVMLPDPLRPSDAALSVQRNRPIERPIVPTIEPSIERPIERACSINENYAGEGADSSAKHRLPVEVGLDDALKRNAISVHYQPQFELQSGRGCGVEALARWTLSNGSSVAPAIFIPVAERSGMIDSLGATVLQSACDTAAAWRGREGERLTVSVNVSTRQINPEFFRILGGILDTSGLPAGRLELEIAEAAVLANTDLTGRYVKEWKRLGVRVAVNHAGTNYSNLKYLSQLPVDRLKLDRSLIQTIAVDKRTAGITHALISLGAALGVDVLAEGVETETQFKMLTELGCKQVQGYLLARPMPAVQAQVALRKPWGNLPKTVQHSSSAMRENYAS